MIPNKFWGTIGAGVLPICTETKRILLAYRSEYVYEPNTWNLWGGKLDDDESDVREACIREFREESGYDSEIELIDSYIYRIPNRFTYYNFIGLIDYEFEPVLDWETSDYEWVTFDELLTIKPKHFGLTALLKNDLNTIRRYTMNNFINNNKISEEAEGGVVATDSPVNSTADVVAHRGRVGKVIKRKRRNPKMKKKFSTIQLKENKLTKEEFESYKGRNNTIIVSIDEDDVEYKLLNFDEYNRVYENEVIIDHPNRKIYIEANSKETINHLLMEGNRNRYNTMKLPEMKHIYSFIKSLTDNYSYVITNNNEEYNIKF